MTIKIIDPHLHLFDLTRGQYQWLQSNNPPHWTDKHKIYRDFTLADLSLNDLSVNNESVKLAGFIHIEAGFDNDKPWREIDFIESLKPKLTSNLTPNLIPNLTPKEIRTIANVDFLADPNVFSSSLLKLQKRASFIGVRHILGNQAFDILHHKNTQQNMSTLNQQQSLVVELQLPLSNFLLNDAGNYSNTNDNVMPLLVKTITDNTNLKFVINHAGFPPLDNKEELFSFWQNNITFLAKLPNVFIKCSGWEMQSRQYQMSWFNNVVQTCINTFSLDRVMLASNFPLCLFSYKSYRDYWLSVLNSDVIANSSEQEKVSLLHNNALRIYQLSM